MAMGPSPRGQGTRVLVVDDGKTERRLIALALRGVACQIDSVASAQAALLALAHSPYDLLLVDQHLPDSLGSALIGLIVREWQAPPPAVLLSADRSAPTRAAALRAGAQAVWPKPAPGGRLRALLRAHAPSCSATPATPLLAEVQAQAFVLGFEKGLERAEWIGRWEREVAAHLAQLRALAALRGAPAQRASQHELHRLRGSAALVGAARLDLLAAALEARSDPASLAALQEAAADTSAALRARAGFLPQKN